MLLQDNLWSERWTSEWILFDVRFGGGPMASEQPCRSRRAFRPLHCWSATKCTWFEWQSARRRLLAFNCDPGALCVCERYINTSAFWWSLLNSDRSSRKDRERGEEEENNPWQKAAASGSHVLKFEQSVSEWGAASLLVSCAAGAARRISINNIN